MPSSGISDTTRSLNVMRRALFLSSFPIGVLTLGIPIYAPTRLGSDALQVGTLMSIYALMTLILRPVVGPAMDRFGRRRFFLAGSALQLFSNVFFATGNSFEWLFWGRLTQGVAAGMMWLSAYAITADLAAQGRHGNMFGSVEEMLARGGLYGGAIGAPILLLTRFDQRAWSGVFVFYAILNAIGLALAWREMPETYQRGEYRRTDSDLRALTRPLLMLASIVFATSLAYFGLAPLLIQFVQAEINDDPIVLGLAYIPSAIVFAFLQSRLGKLADRVGRKPPIAVGMITSGMSSAIIPLLPALIPSIGQWVLLPLVGLWVCEAVALSAATPAEQALVADLSSEKDRGKAFGLYTTAQSLGQVIGPTFSGYLYESVSHSAPFYFNMIVLWLAAVIIVLFIQDPRGRQVARPVLPHEPPSQWPSAGGAP